MFKQRPFDAFLQTKLTERQAENRYRTLVCYDDKIDFSSNDYLGFARLAALKTPPNENTLAGSTGSRLISGNSKQAVDAERTVADFHLAEAALLFNCGYMANVGLFSAIASRNDTIVSDEFIHASIIDGIRLSNANKTKFKNNDLADLERKLVRIAAGEPMGNTFVAVESLYSMDGDKAPLSEIAALCDHYNALLIVDEAHAIGVFGVNGCGLVCEYQLQDRVFACVYTFGKALGLHGAAVVGSQTLINYLINFSRPFIYSTAMPPHAYTQIETAYQLLYKNDAKILFERIDYFKKAIAKLKNLNFIDSSSQIQGLIVGDNAKAKALSAHLLQKGIYVKAILSPTVPVGKERLRICLHAYNTTTEIDYLIESLFLFKL